MAVVAFPSRVTGFRAISIIAEITFIPRFLTSSNSSQREGAFGLSCRLIFSTTFSAIYRPVSRTVKNFSVVMIEFKNVMPANAQYTQSCRVIPAQASTAVIRKKRIAVLRYHIGDASRFFSSAISVFNRKEHEGFGKQAFCLFSLPLCPLWLFLI